MANKKAWKKVDEGWADVLTRQQALEIRKIRKRGATWRRVASFFAEDHPDMNVCNGNQPEGFMLCEAAGKILKQDHWKW